MPWPLQKNNHPVPILQSIPDDLWFKIIPFLEIRELQRLSLAYRQATKIFFRADVDCHRFFFIQALIAEIEAQRSLKVYSINNKMISKAERKLNIKNWLCRIGPFISTIVIVPPLAINFEQAQFTKSNFIENVLKPSCTLQWSHFASWFANDDSCVTLFNCTASLCATAEFYQTSASGYLLALVILSIVSLTITLSWGFSLITQRCRPYSIEPVITIHHSALNGHLLGNVVSRDVQKLLSSVLNSSLIAVASEPIGKILNDLKLLASSIKSDKIPLPQKISTRLKNLSHSRRNQFFNTDTVSIDVQPDCNEEKKAFLS